MTPVRRVVGVALNAAIDKTASVPALVPGEIHRPEVLSAVPGGKAANVVRAAAHLGLPGSVVAVIGGHAGAWYRAALEARSIPLHAVDVEGETRTCLSVLDKSTGTLTEFYEPGVTLSTTDWARVEAAVREALAIDAAGAVVVLAVGGEPLAVSLGANPWLVKVNAHEAESITGTSARTETRAITAAGELRRRGASVAIVTRGVHGAVLASDEGTWVLGNLPARLRGPFTVGSGDAFLAGYLAGIARGMDPDGALRLAGAAGAANARIPGQGELDPADVDRTLDAVEVSPR